MLLSRTSVRSTPFHCIYSIIPLLSQSGDGMSAAAIKVAEAGVWWYSVFENCLDTYMTGTCRMGQDRTLGSRYDFRTAEHDSNRSMAMDGNLAHINLAQSLSNVTEQFLAFIISFARLNTSVAIYLRSICESMSSDCVTWYQHKRSTNSKIETDFLRSGHASTVILDSHSVTHHQAHR